MSLVVKGGSVLTPRGMRVCDVVVEGDVVVSLEQEAQVPGATVIDAGGCLVGPGFVDLHTHLRDPGHIWKEDLASGSAAAAAGGFTAVIAMPNTDPPLDDPKLVHDVVSRGEEVGLTQVAVAGSVTLGRAGEDLAPLEDLFGAGVRVFTDDGDSVPGPLLGEALRRLGALPGAVLAQHAEDPGLGSSSEAEVVRRDLGVLRMAGGRYHCQHVSSADTVELLKRAREEGMAVTAEVAPHHLTFDDSTARPGDPNFKMYPPLRSIKDRQALIEALRAGLLDVVATDHAPHSDEEKAVGLDEAPRGVIGLETAAAAVWEAVGDPIRLFEVLSLAPARIAGLDDQGHTIDRGAAAHLVVFDPGAGWTVDSFASRSRNSPYLGRAMRGRVMATIYRGRITHKVET